MPYGVPCTGTQSDVLRVSNFLPASQSTFRLNTLCFLCSVRLEIRATLLAYALVCFIQLALCLHLSRGHGKVYEVGPSLADDRVAPSSTQHILQFVRCSQISAESMSGPKNQAAWLKKANTPLEVGDAPLPKAGEGEIVVKNAAVAINPLDCHMQDAGVFVQQWPTIFGWNEIAAAHKIELCRLINEARPFEIPSRILSDIPLPGHFCPGGTHHGKQHLYRNCPSIGAAPSMLVEEHIPGMEEIDEDPEESN